MINFSIENLIDLRRLIEAKITDLNSTSFHMEAESERLRQVKSYETMQREITAEIESKILESDKDEAFEEEQRYAE